ncbi:GST protein [Aphelenchoides besseyi]|nr:GST protein [Aphelenchoides besseyi]KAI6200705.1 GST protein [Aphelenchoides besseyi]
MVQFKLWYFDVRNLAEAARLIFVYANQPFEDFRIPFDEWQTVYKNQTPFGKIPVLEVDGKRLCESTTILRYLAKKFKLAGRTTWEKAQVDELIELHRSEYAEMHDFLMVSTGFKAGDKVVLLLKTLIESFQKELFEKVAKPTTQHYFQIYSRILKDNNTGYFVGKSLTCVDLLLADYLHTVHELNPELFEGHLDLVGFVKRIYLMPRLKSYIENRPVSPL